MKTKWMGLVLGLGLVGAPLSAHHSFDAEFDKDHPVTISGTIKQVIWKGPHVRLFVDAKDEGGGAANWELELDSPNALMKQGWKVDSLKVGDPVTVDGYPAKDGAKVMRASKVTLAAR